MTSSPSSEVRTLALLAVLVLAAAAPAAAVSVSDESVPSEAAVGETVEATFTITELYQEPNFQRWTLQGNTELVNATWTVAYKNPSGEVFAQRQYNGSFEQPGISAEGGEFDSPVTEIEITIRGTVPDIEEFTYDEPETFVVATLSQQAGETGSTNEIDTWGAHHYTTGGAESPGSREARQAIQDAEAAIEEARAENADTSQANSTLQNAIEFYNLGQFQQAVDNAEDAETQADEAKDAAESNQLIMYAGAAVLVVALLGGGFWYYQQQQDDYDKLG